MIVLDGKAVSEKIYEDITVQNHLYIERGFRKPHLAVLLVGDNPASKIYVNAKLKIARRIHFDVSPILLPAHTTQTELEARIHSLSLDTDIDGIILQLPLPMHLKKNRLVQSIPVEKDVDGFHFENIGRIFTDQMGFIAATPYGIVLLLDAYNVSLKGKHVVIVGRSHIVGKPLGLLLQSGNQWGNATVTLCHSYTPDIAYFTKQADVVVMAVGHPGLLKADMIKEGAIVIDVGINRVEDTTHIKGYRIQGDVYFDDTLRNKVAYFTPVPGGVGPMTIVALMKNTLSAYKKYHLTKF